MNDNQRQNNDIGRQKIDNVESKRQKPTPTAKFIPRYEDDISQKKGPDTLYPEDKYNSHYQKHNKFMPKKGVPLTPAGIAKKVAVNTGKKIIDKKFNKNKQNDNVENDNKKNDDKNNLPSKNEGLNKENDAPSKAQPKNNNPLNKIPKLGSMLNPNKSKETLEAKGKKIALKFILKNPVVLLIIGIIIFGLFIIAFLMAFFGLDADAQDSTYEYGVGNYPYVAPKCTTITVVDGETPGTYSETEYTAGVVDAEFGIFHNEEMFKIASVIVRTYMERVISDECTIHSSESVQVFRKTKDQTVISAVNATNGIVMADNDNNMLLTQYDAFCWDTKDDNNYYVCQKNQSIPVSWVLENVPKYSSLAFTATPHYRSHGQGLSQDGAMYLISTGQTFDKILKYYYGDGWSLKSIYGTTHSNSYTGKYPIDPDSSLYRGTKFLYDKSLESLLNDNNTSLQEYSANIQNNIAEAGIGTREGVVASAVNLIGSLAEMGYRLPYQWGGKYNQVGISGNWGSPANTDCSSYGYGSKCRKFYQWSSFDCSGFVNWAIINGTQNAIQIPYQYTTNDGISLSGKTEAVCDAGDVLVNSEHIVLVVGKNDALSSYIVAESTGDDLTPGEGGVQLKYYAYNGIHGSHSYYCRKLNY